jgi:PAS domain S-box-containing protein
MTDFLRDVIEALPAAFIAIDRDGRYRYFNSAAERLLGGRPGEAAVAGSPTYVTVFHADGVTPMKRNEIPIMRALAGDRIDQIELVVKNAAFADGRHISASAGPVTNAAGDTVGAVTVMHDITDRIETEKRLRETRQVLERTQKMEALGRLAGGVAHDFNNLLTVISGYAQMIEEVAEGRPEGNDAIEIRRATERAAALTKQLLALGRKSVVERTVVAPDTAVAELSEMVRRLLGPDIEMSIVPGHAPPVLVDRGQLDQVLVNLAVNARDAMPHGGRLTIETALAELDDEAAALRGLSAGRYAMIAVTDTGVGMDRETQARIFEPFFTTKEAGKGTGLGLSIIHGIVGQAGGTVNVYSERGFGTTIRVYMPVATGHAATVVEPRPEPPSTLPPVTVMFVEDDPQVREIGARALRVAGCAVIEAATAVEARRRAQSHDGPIAVLVTDLVLADGRGETIARELTESRPEMRVVFASGYPATAVSGLPGVQHVTKPYTPKELRGAVALAAATTETAPRPGRAAPRALVVDDDELVRRTIGRVLSKSGCEVVLAGSGREAVTAISAASFDVVISDVHMPDGNGLDLLRSIRRVDLDIPVIMATGVPDVASAAEALEYGAFRYLTKPVDGDELVRLVKHATRVHALARLRREAMSAAGMVSKLAADRAGLEVRFESAFDSLWLAYQPIVDARTGAVLGVEALLRSEDAAMATPDAMLDAAAKLGRMPALGRRIRARATDGFSPAPNHLMLFVNLLPDELFDPELLAADSPLMAVANRVVLEITERAALRVSPELTKRIQRLRAVGYRLAVDDIGAGYSGLTSFAELVPEIVKIDMALVRDVHRSAVRQHTIRSLCSLCHDLGTLVIGEGVETQIERDCLVDLGCDMLQGFLLGRPSRELPS